MRQLVLEVSRSRKPTLKGKVMCLYGEIILLERVKQQKTVICAASKFYHLSFPKL